MGSCLSFASGTGDLEIVKLLLEYGADINYVDKYNKSILYYIYVYIKSNYIILNINKSR
jgi:ankyrin repeat protein